MAIVYWDKEEALNRFSHSDTTLKHLVIVFMECMPHFLENLNISIQKRDFHSISFNAHSIKGSAANIGAKVIAEITQEIESIAKSSHDKIELIITLKDRLSIAWKETIVILEEYINSLAEDEELAFSSEEFYLEIKKIRHSLEHGEFIDSSTLDVFHTKVPNTLQKSLKDLEFYIDTFKTKQAFSVIEDILHKESN